MKRFRFLDWQVYKDAQQLLRIAIDIVKSFPKEYRFEVGSQFIRAALSVILNIAEGRARSSDNEMNRFFNIALGSLHETMAVVDTLHQLKLITKTQLELAREQIVIIDNQLGGFKKKLRTS